MKTHQVIVEPLLTEKSTNLVKSNVYTFHVHEDANKNQITAVLESTYKVKIDSIRIVKRKGKVRRAGRRMNTINMPDKKIAYVHLKEGKIDLFPQS
jgi:large subunit ribosomal protein L23